MEEKYIPLPIQFILGYLSVLNLPFTILKIQGYTLLTVQFLAYIGPTYLSINSCFLPRLVRLNLSGLDTGPEGEWTVSLPAVGSLEEASESPPSRSALH